MTKEKERKEKKGKRGKEKTHTYMHTLTHSHTHAHSLSLSHSLTPSLSFTVSLIVGTVAAELQKEMTNINTSLHVLGLCVSALTEPNRKHIPYRNSVLTRLLQDPLGGNGKTVIVATVHEDPRYAEETRSTLHFASRASKIKVRQVPLFF